MNTNWETIYSLITGSSVGVQGGNSPVHRRCLCVWSAFCYYTLRYLFFDFSKEQSRLFFQHFIIRLSEIRIVSQIKQHIAGSMDILHFPADISLLSFRSEMLPAQISHSLNLPRYCPVSFSQLLRHLGIDVPRYHNVILCCFLMK